MKNFYFLLFVLSCISIELSSSFDNDIRIKSDAIEFLEKNNQINFLNNVETNFFPNEPVPPVIKILLLSNIYSNWCTYEKNENIAKEFLAFFSLVGSILSLFSEKPKKILFELNLILLKEKNISLKQIETEIKKRDKYLTLNYKFYRLSHFQNLQNFLL